MSKIPINKFQTFNEPLLYHARTKLNRRELNVKTDFPIYSPAGIDNNSISPIKRFRIDTDVTDIENIENIADIENISVINSVPITINFLTGGMRGGIGYLIRSIITCIFAAVAIFYSIEKGAVTFAQTTIHVNEQQFQSQYYSYNYSSGSGSWGSWSNWSNGSGGSYTGTNYGNNYFSNIANLVSTLGGNNSNGGIVELCTDIKGNYSHTNTNLSGTSFAYRSGWLNNSSTTSQGGNFNVDTNHSVTLLNKLSGIGTSSSPLTIVTINKNGNGTFKLDHVSSSSLYLHSTTFTGNGGTFIIGGNYSVNYSSATSNVGASTGFNAAVTSGSLWIAGNLTAHDIFNISGAGTLNTSNMIISGTTTSTIATSNTGTLTVGVTAGDGNFIINGGNVISSTVNIANNNHNGLVRLDGAGVTWTTSNIVNVGNTGTNKTGTVDIVNGTWNANDQINIANTANGNGVVNIKGNSVWNANNQTVNVGLNGNGAVNQSGGNWTNKDTRVGVSLDASGSIDQSGGSHLDSNAAVGVYGKGTADIHGTNTNWTTDDQNSTSDNTAIIGQYSTADGRISVYDNAAWTIGKVGNSDNLITADNGLGELNVYTGAKVNVAGNHIIANNATGFGTDNVYLGGELIIAGDSTTGNAGKAQLRVYSSGKVSISGDHTVANISDSYGSDQVDGIGSVMDITGDMIVGEFGTAGGHYVYYPEGSRDATFGVNFNNAGNTIYGDNSLGGGFYKDPDSWLNSPNLTLHPLVPSWVAYSEDAPGIAITAGGVINVHGTDGVKVANQSGSYAYILLDNKNGGAGRSTWNIDHDLVMGVLNRANDNADDAYMRIINGSLVSVGGQVIIADGAGTEVIVRVNGMRGSNVAVLEAVQDLTIAKGVASGAAAEGNLYVYDHGRVEVGKGGNANMTIAETNNSFGRVHVDGEGSTIVVNGLLTAAKEGYAGNKYQYYADNNPDNDNLNDPSNLGKWFDSFNTLLDLQTSGGINDNAPGLLITRGAVVTSQSGNVAEAAGSYAYVVIDGKDSTSQSTKWTITDNNLIIADRGESYTRIFNGGLLETTNTVYGNIIISNESGSIATVRVFNNGSKIESAVDLIVSNHANSDGQLYIYDRAAGHVGRNMIIANEADSNAQVQVDGAGTQLEIDHRLTVGNYGNAGGYYNENRYNPATVSNSAVQDKGYRLDPYQLNDPSDRWWFDSANMNLRDNKNYEGNAPGLAITDGGIVVSGSGLVGAYSLDGSTLDSIGYVLIDNHYGFNGATGRRQGERSTWHVKELGTADEQNGDLIIGREGKGFVRVLNGGLLDVDGHTKLNSRINNADTNYNYVGIGSLYIVGNGGSIRAIPNSATATNIPQYVTTYDDGNRSTWISHKAAILGDTGNSVKGGESTIRINGGAYGETHGIYAGYCEGSRGDVSVMGKASELHIYKDELLGSSGYEYSISDIKGSGGLSVSNNALLQIHDDGNITLNGMSLISHNSLLHLNRNSILDSRQYSAKIVNARVEGIGTITAESGVTFLYDSTYADSVTDPVYSFIDGKLASIVTKATSTQIDPGLYYGWSVIDEYYNRYGKLTFGDRLTLVGNISIFFDVNSGWPIPGDSSAPGTVTNQLNDTILVKRGKSSASTADVIATLSGTLKIHARLTGYFVDEPSFQVVQTEGDSQSGQFVPGRITRIFDRLEIVPWRFFENPHQEIRQDVAQNDSLWVSMKLKKNPFEEAGITYNEKSTGNALDDIYNKRDERWLPVLRYFWYLEDPEFLDAYRTLSGEIRAHSLLLPMQNPWIYNQNRFGFRKCLNKSHTHGYDKINQIDPCEMSKMANNVQGCDSYCDKLKKCWDRVKKDMRFWGDYIYEQADYNSDGNAGAFNLNRNGVVFGFDKSTSDGKQYAGLQFAIVKGEINAFLSEAKVDDFNIGIYHGKKIHNVFDWRNFIGIGIENYKMTRTLNSGLAYYEWVWDTPDKTPSTDPSDGHYQYSDEAYNGKLRSAFNGCTFYANTELARPFILGTCNQYTIRPYAALDIIAVQQKAASENGSFRGADFVRLDFLSANYVRAYGRPGILFERNGDHLNLHAGLSYNFKMAGRHYSNVDNKFQISGKKFNIRSVDTGNDFLNLNCGAEWYIGKKKNQFVMINYQALLGKNLTTQSAQLGYQYKF